MNIDRGLTPGSFLRRLLTFSDRLLLICLLAKPFYTSLPFILKIYPPTGQSPPQCGAFVSDSKSSLGWRWSLKSPFPHNFRDVKASE